MLLFSGRERPSIQKGTKGMNMEKARKNGWKNQMELSIFSSRFQNELSFNEVKNKMSIHLVFISVVDSDALHFALCVSLCLSVCKLRYCFLNFFRFQFWWLLFLVCVFTFLIFLSLWNLLCVTSKWTQCLWISCRNIVETFKLFQCVSNSLNPKHYIISVNFLFSRNTLRS